MAAIPDKVVCFSRAIGQFSIVILIDSKYSGNPQRVTTCRKAKKDQCNIDSIMERTSLAIENSLNSNLSIRLRRGSLQLVRVSPLSWSPNGNNAVMHSRRCRHGVMTIESSVLFRNVRSESSDSPVQ
jgi:hypothetical protein